MTVSRIRMLSDHGTIELPVEVGADAARLIGTHWNAVKRFLHTGDVTGLIPFAIWRIGRHRFAVDPSWIEAWAARGELDFEDIYESSGSS
jgi:hypothetical protein